MSYFIDAVVSDSKLYKNLRADKAFQFASTYLSIDYEGVIKLTEEIEDIISDLQTLEVDKNIFFSIHDFDQNQYVQHIFVIIAEMCTGDFACDTLAAYMDDAALTACQLAIAHSVPGFYNRVKDKSNIRDEVKSYLKIVS